MNSPEIVRQKLPDGGYIVRTTTNESRIYHVEQPDGEHRSFEVVEGQSIEKLYSTTNITGFPDKSGPLVGWATKEVANRFTELLRAAAPQLISRGGMEAAKPHTMLYMAARDWLIAGEDPGAVSEKIANLNTAFAQPLDPQLLSQMLKAAARDARKAIASFNHTVSAFRRDARWAHEREKDRTADVGTRVHHWAEMDMKGVQLPITPDIKKPVAAYKEWRKTEGIASIVALERMLYHPAGFAGTVDAVLRLTDSQVAVVDFKTSASIYDSHILQIGAYGAGWTHTYGDPIDVGWVVRFGRDDGAMEAARINVSPAWEAFHSLVPAYHRHTLLKQNAPGRRMSASLHPTKEHSSSTAPVSE